MPDVVFRNKDSSDNWDGNSIKLTGKTIKKLGVDGRHISIIINGVSGNCAGVEGRHVSIIIITGASGNCAGVQGRQVSSGLVWDLLLPLASSPDRRINGFFSISFKRHHPYHSSVVSHVIVQVLKVGMSLS